MGELRELLVSRYGARRLPELDPEHYDDLLAILGRVPDQGSGSDCGRPALSRWMIREPVRLADEFGFEFSFPISRHLDAQRPVVGQNGLATLAVAVVGRRRRLVGTGGVTQVVVHLGPQSPPVPLPSARLLDGARDTPARLDVAGQHLPPSGSSGR